MQNIEQAASRSQERTSEGERVEAAQRSMARFSRYAAYFWGTVAFLEGVGLGLVVWYRRVAPPVPVRVPRLQRWLLQARVLRARLNVNSVLSLLLALLCFTGAVAPWIVSFFSSVEDITWYFVAITFVGVLAGLHLLVRAKRLAALTVAAVTTIDDRPPILLLRSFANDLIPILRTNDQWAWMRSIIAPTRWTLEESIEQSLGRHGPLIAIGRPGEQLPPAGAAREYVPNEHWQQRVQEFIKQAHAVVVVLGDTPGLQFEYDALRRLGALRKMIIVLPPISAERLAVSWGQFARTALGDDKAYPVDPPDLTTVLAVYIAADGTPCFVTCHRRDDEDCYRLAVDECLAARETVG